ncbi:dienelactone hydrolase family protein [Thiococcus pfennigii]|uniref:dienelactone hydrolase family protein n=1 Tax=Thiococcus pfennigii TaxID=1057 RepID=UPI00190659A9|nr:dienelactone hydrolase family protein [Thiococcus pfennigii]MBK1732831.1 hydrolase [Thiococcus pfennigii]
MTGHEEEVLIGAAGVTLAGHLTIPPQARGIVVFAHGSGSSRFSTRNRYVAEVIDQGGLATLLFDLLTEDEGAVDEITRAYRFDIPLLGERLVGTVDWLRAHPHTAALKIALFGASTGAAAALIAAAERPDAVAAVVSRGGRPDLARDHLARVEAPTLLIIGGLDGPVIAMNREAAAQLRCERRIEIIPGATHLFGEPGKLEAVATLTRDWLVQQIG